MPIERLLSSVTAALMLSAMPMLAPSVSAQTAGRDRIAEILHADEPAPAAPQQRLAQSAPQSAPQSGAKGQAGAPKAQPAPVQPPAATPEPAPLPAVAPAPVAKPKAQKSKPRKKAPAAAS